MRVVRVSFSGELAFEVNVDALVRAGGLGTAASRPGEPYGITPYGTETMHVLRAEKGYPIIGQDTDGTVTPQDLGMAWAVSKKKPDFLGKRSFARGREPATRRASSWSGLLPGGPHATCCPRARRSSSAPTQLPEPPVPDARARHLQLPQRRAGPEFALALVKGGRDRIGETVHVPVAGELVPVEITEPVLVDPEGARRDG